MIYWTHVMIVLSNKYNTWYHPDNHQDIIQTYK